MGNSISNSNAAGTSQAVVNNGKQYQAGQLLRDIEQLDEDIEESFNNNLPPSQFKMENEKNNNVCR